MTPTDQQLARAREAVEQAFDGDGLRFLALSGGKDALALLKLCEPYAGRFKLIWANTGHTFPHVETLIRAEGERYGIEEIRPAFRRIGRPTAGRPRLRPSLAPCR